MYRLYLYGFFHIKNLVIEFLNKIKYCQEFVKTKQCGEKGA